jgi:type II secretory pathway pseudopilin PulG
MTLIEVIVAAMILALGALSTFGLLGAATRNAQRARASQVALDRAQQEIEALRSLNNDELAMTAAPAHATSSHNPNYRVSAGTFATTREPVGGYATMIVNGGSLFGGGFVEGGVITPGPVQFTSGNVSGKVYRYVVWRNDSSCPAATCPGTQDYKQIVVAVKLDTPGNQSGERGYVEVASNFVDPEDNALNDPIPGAEGVVTAQQFFLTDTPCAASGTTSRIEIAGDHLLHNTLGTCASGLHTGTTLGAPDALMLGGPPDPAPTDNANPLKYDYSHDSYLSGTPETDKGVQILRDDTSGCHYNPSGTTDPESQVHRWVTDPMLSTFKMSDDAATEGSVTLEFYTRSLNLSLYKATLCVYLFKREETGSPPKATDTFLINKATGLTYWEYTPPNNKFWPQDWEKVRVPMTYSSAPYTIPAKARLGVALSFDRGKTGPEAIPIMYDHPTYPTRIEVETTTPIDGG